MCASLYLYVIQYYLKSGVRIAIIFWIVEFLLLLFLLYLSFSCDLFHTLVSFFSVRGVVVVAAVVR